MMIAYRYASALTPIARPFRVATRTSLSNRARSGCEGIDDVLAAGSPRRGGDGGRRGGFFSGMSARPISPARVAEDYGGRWRRFKSVPRPFVRIDEVPCSPVGVNFATEAVVKADGH